MNKLSVYDRRGIEVVNMASALVPEDLASLLEIAVAHDDIFFEPILTKITTFDTVIEFLSWRVFEELAEKMLEIIEKDQLA